MGHLANKSNLSLSAASVKNLEKSFFHNIFFLLHFISNITDYSLFHFLHDSIFLKAFLKYGLKIV